MKTNRIFPVVIIAAFSMLLTSCWFMGPSVKGNGNVTEEVRQVEEFDQIKVTRGMNVYINQGSPSKVVVIADNNLHEIITTEVRGRVLTVSVNENIRWAKEKKVIVTLENLSGVETNSGSNAWSQNQIMSENMELKSSSGANLTMEVNAKRLQANCSSGANIRISGLAEEANLEASSGANLKAPDLNVEDCQMRASSGANVSAKVTGRLEAHASSGGNVVYYGTPGSSEVKTSSGGNVHGK
ncbi:MAG: head GIN domain-containing protein [Prolixibacteraceae bacterium]